MGVVHKLTEEIADFIIQQKKQCPSVSCRHLALAVQDAFQVEISKSSINSFLKSSQLSGAVGRRPGDVRTKKFQIPSQKKEEIFNNLQKAGLSSEKIDDPPLPRDDPPMTLLPDPVQVTVEDKGSPPPSQGGASGQSVFLEDVEKRRAARAQGVLYEGMGQIFLKAAEWDIFSRPWLAEILKRQFPREAESFREAHCAAARHLRFLGCGPDADVRRFQDQAFWNFCGIAQPEQIQDFFVSTAAAAVSPETAIRYLQEMRQSLIRVRRIRIDLEDGNSLDMDAGLGCLGPAGMELRTAAPLNKVLGMISRQFISSHERLAYGCPAADAALTTEWAALAAACDGCAGMTIQRAALLDCEERELAAFSIIPKKRRMWMISLEARHAEFDRIAAAVPKNGKVPVYEAFSDQVIFTAQAQMDLTALSLDGLSRLRRPFLARAIALFREEQETPFKIILTNDERARIEEVVTAYFLRWPLTAGESCGGGENPDSAGDADAPQIEKISSVNGLFDHFNGQLHRYGQQCFFAGNLVKLDMREALKAVYGLPGFWQDHDCWREVVLVLPPHCPCQRELAAAIQRVNQGYVRDFQGKPLRVRAQ